VQVGGNVTFVFPAGANAAPGGPDDHAIPGWERIDAAFLDSKRAPVSEQRVLKYFSGKEPGWEEALFPAIRPREIVGELHGLVRRACVVNETCVTVLMGATGEGKSTGLRQTVAKLVEEDPDVCVVWRRDLSARLPVSELADLPVCGHWLFVADSAENIAKDVLNGLHTLIEAGRTDIHFLLSSRRTDWVIARVPEPRQWERQCDLKVRRLRGLSANDASSIVTAWQAYGAEGMGELAGLTTEHAASRLESESRSETDAGEGSLLGAMLRLRYGYKLQSHIARLIDCVDANEHFSPNLITALACVAIPHADGLLTLPRVVLMKALAIPNLVHLDENVIFPLADEALVASSGTTITTRHRAVAECIAKEIRDRHGDHYLDDIYVGLAMAVVESQSEGRIPDFETWNYLSRRFFDAGNRVRGIRIARAVVSRDPANAYYRATLARLLREDNTPDEALEVFQNSPPATRVHRGYCYEWAASAGMAGDLALNVVLALFSVADWQDNDLLESSPVGNKQAKISLNGVTRAFIPLFEQHGDDAFRQACGGAAQLALNQGLELDSMSLDYLNRSRNWATDHGVPDDVSPETAFERLMCGLQAAWDQLQSDPPAFVMPPSEMTFNGLRRLLRLADES